MIVHVGPTVCVDKPQLTMRLQFSDMEKDTLGLLPRLMSHSNTCTELHLECGLVHTYSISILYSITQKECNNL